MKPDPSKLDLGGIVTGSLSAAHLQGALVRAWGEDVVVTARHLGMEGGQQVVIGGERYTIAGVRGVDVPVTGSAAERWRDDLLFNGDLAVATLRETVPARVTRYAIAGVALGKGHMLHANDKLSTFPFQPRTGFRNWTRGSYLRPAQFRDGDSGRPILMLDRHGKTLLCGVLSRIWWGEWLTLKPQHLQLS